MANPEHVERVRRGPEGLELGKIWDLTNLDLRHADLSFCNLSGGILTGSDLEEANLQQVEAFRTSADHCNFTAANLSGANLVYTDLSESNLTAAYLSWTRFQDADLRKAEFEEATFVFAAIADCDLSRALGLSKAVVLGPSSIGTDTLRRTLVDGGRIFSAEVYEFLIRCGVPRSLLDHLPSLLEANPIQFLSCFISYTTNDNDFADRLYGDLTKEGVTCWKYDEDAVPGFGVWANIGGAISLHEKVIAICSEQSLTRPGVPREVERALQKEDALRSEGRASSVLVPVALDEFVFKWEHDRQPDVVAKHVQDFNGWEKDSTIYDNGFKKLLKALDPSFTVGTPVNQSQNH